MNRKEIYFPLYVVIGAASLAAVVAGYVNDSELFRLLGRIGLVGLIVLFFFHRK
ncbi:hypothetical protein [Alteribacter populi]|uniref:hypothetical protein n=1 Tax=Alteribacter populi TaxID=2011011 RepID=UPI0012FDF83A|nr:hypothetical protein [Alteribacter populi]